MANTRSVCPGRQRRLWLKDCGGQAVSRHERRLVVDLNVVPGRISDGRLSDRGHGICGVQGRRRDCGRRVGFSDPESDTVAAITQRRVFVKCSQPDLVIPEQYCRSQLITNTSVSQRAPTAVIGSDHINDFIHFPRKWPSLCTAAKMTKRAFRACSMAAGPSF